MLHSFRISIKKERDWRVETICSSRKCSWKTIQKISWYPNFFVIFIHECKCINVFCTGRQWFALFKIIFIVSSEEFVEVIYQNNERHLVATRYW